MPNCSFKVRENLETRSVFCGKLQQWVSSNYCNLCLERTDLTLLTGNKVEKYCNNEAASSTKTTNENFSFYLYYVTSYLASYLHLEPKPKTQNTSKRLPTVSPSLKKF